MRPLHLVVLAALAAPASQPATAEETTIPAPAAGPANYDPTMSAKEAVLANWDLAASGIGAGELVGRRVVAKAEDGASHRSLARLAGQAERTMVQRWNAAQWIYAGVPELERLDGAALRDAVAATATSCGAEPCAEEIAALRDAFAEASAQMEAVAAAARGEVEARTTRGDAVLMAEQLRAVADYLEGGAWAEDLTLAAFDRDREEVAARLVGAMAIWRNLEPYVGLISPEIDDAINASAEQLLRTLRLGERQEGPLTPDGPELAALRERAETLAAEFRRAAALFAV